MTLKPKRIQNFKNYWISNFSVFRFYFWNVQLILYIFMFSNVIFYFLIYFLEHSLHVIILEYKFDHSIPRLQSIFLCCFSNLVWVIWPWLLSFLVIFYWIPEALDDVLQRSSIFFWQADHVDTIKWVNDSGDVKSQRLDKIGRNLQFIANW